MTEELTKITDETTEETASKSLLETGLAASTTPLIGQGSLYQQLVMFESTRLVATSPLELVNARVIQTRPSTGPTGITHEEE